MPERNAAAACRRARPTATTASTGSTGSTGSTDTVIELIFGCYRRHAPPAADKRTPVDKHPTVHERVI
ncbi:hypothetical protein EUB03_06500 [Mycobacterium tuberculosis]|nr:hypothetical protein FPJ48_00405 [Mycobacterium tuberculosis]RXR57160.1 hypothetical protein EUB03_06500 [Mycobacterium tuberculosis]